MSFGGEFDPRAERYDAPGCVCKPSTTMLASRPRECSWCSSVVDYVPVSPQFVLCAFFHYRFPTCSRALAFEAGKGYPQSGLHSNSSNGNNTMHTTHGLESHPLNSDRHCVVGCLYMFAQRHWLTSQPCPHARRSSREAATTSWSAAGSTPRPRGPTPSACVPPQP